MASEEARELAEKLVRMVVAHETPDCTLVVAGVSLYSVNASQGPMSDLYGTVTELQAGLATAIDDHTAALRAERDELKATLEAINSEKHQDLQRKLEQADARIEAQRKRLERHRL